MLCGLAGATSENLPFVSLPPSLREADNHTESQPQPESDRNLSHNCCPSSSLPPAQEAASHTAYPLPPQVVKHLPKAHILACAPSNSGADLLCQRLRVHLPSSIYRLLAPSRDIRMVPEDIKVPGAV